MDLILDYLLQFHNPLAPYLFLFGFLVICGLGLPIPEDIILFAAGLSAYYGLTDLISVIVLCYFGVIIGDSIIFYLGRRFGRRLTNVWMFRRLLSEERLLKVQDLLANRGNRIIFVARFMPGLRAPLFFTSGTLHVQYSAFIFYNGLAALLSVPLIIALVFFGGDELDHVVRLIQKVEHGIAFGVIGIVLFFGLKWYLKRPKG